MTEEEAFRILGSVEDPVDGFQEQLFAIRQSILMKVPFTKVYRLKKERIKSLQSAVETFVGISDETFTLPAVEKLEGPVEKVFHDFHRIRNSIQHRMHISENGNQLCQLMDRYLELYKSYAQQWEVEGAKKEEGIVLSVEPDPMALLDAIRHHGSEKELLFSDIKAGNVDEMLINEAKRLTLWLQFERENGELR